MSEWVYYLIAWYLSGLIGSFWLQRQDLKNGFSVTYGDIIVCFLAAVLGLLVLITAFVMFVAEIWNDTAIGR